MMAQLQREGTLFQTSLKSQDDFCVKYEVFKDDSNGDSQNNIEKVI